MNEIDTTAHILRTAIIAVVGLIQTHCASLMWRAGYVKQGLAHRSHQPQRPKLGETAYPSLTEAASATAIGQCLSATAKTCRLW
jgi:hypothetical protein